MSDQTEVTEKEVFKAIGHLDEATETMKREALESKNNEEEIVGLITIIGRIIRGIFER